MYNKPGRRSHAAGRERKDDEDLRRESCARSCADDFPLAHLPGFSRDRAGALLVAATAGQNFLLIFASYIFYGWEHPWFLLPLWASTVVDYSCALGMERFPLRRRVFLITSICASIALLATFKYYGFAIENINAILTNFGAEPIRNTLPARPPRGAVVLHFSIDRLRRRCLPRTRRAVRDFPDYALYVTFFPQLVAGPIERAASHAAAISQPAKMRCRRVAHGAWSDVVGLLQESRDRGQRRGRREQDLRSSRTRLSRSFGPASSRLPSRSTPIFPATPTSRAARRGCSGSI